MTRKVCLIAVVFAALLTLCSGTDFAQTVTQGKRWKQPLRPWAPRT